MPEHVSTSCVGCCDVLLQFGGAHVLPPVPPQGAHASCPGKVYGLPMGAGVKAAGQAARPFTQPLLAGCLQVRSARQARRSCVVSGAGAAGRFTSSVGCLAGGARVSNCPRHNAQPRFIPPMLCAAPEFGRSGHVVPDGELGGNLAGTRRRMRQRAGGGDLRCSSAPLLTCSSAL